MGQKLIINADDFGLTLSCTKAIYDAYTRGLITDTTMVANGNAQAEALRLLREDPSFGEHIGIHFNLTEGTPLTTRICHQEKLVSGRKFTGYFRDSKTNLIPLTPEEKQAIREELEAQVRKLSAFGVTITHADSHHHVHTNLQLCSIFSSVMKQYKIQKVRLRKNACSYDLAHDFVWNSYNRWARQWFITTDYMGGILDYQEPYDQYDGIMEVMVHPDYDENGHIVDRSGIKKMADISNAAIDRTGISIQRYAAEGELLSNKIKPICDAVSGRTSYPDLH